jgi:hypothetical protein
MSAEDTRNRAQIDDAKEGSNPLMCRMKKKSGIATVVISGFHRVFLARNCS